MPKLELKSRHVYRLKDESLICIDRSHKKRLFFNSRNEKRNYLYYRIYFEDQVADIKHRKEYVLLKNIKLDNKALYLFTNELYLLDLTENPEPLIIDEVHIRLNDNLLSYSKELTQEYNKNLLEQLINNEEEEYRQKRTKRKNR
ncbi:hypothetical protein SSYRP_v1c05790 [Spiroplasma syrphidicola EA-1]|uniref:Uncharacterized protein n=1 Tax=Spiroplasma syrphidicola EA-1 TaxID=1276229 RepID=R4UE46_9MOLU|nr:hypothetical protein [Spiroplasma syrphidicola]AGM26169.1 hypothetical protein SSYRP_v1c05790 [Spiroplasma syrphidicola EA-1]